LFLDLIALSVAPVIFLDYIYVITWLPAATVLYSKWFENTGDTGLGFVFLGSSQSVLIFVLTGFCKCTCCCSGERNETPPQWFVAGGIGAVFGLPTAMFFSAYFWWLGGQGEVYRTAYTVGLVTFFLLFVGVTVRIGLTIYRRQEGRKAAEAFGGKFTDFLVTNEKARMGLLIGAGGRIQTECWIYTAPCTHASCSLH
jgi:hypothetical protein